LLIGKNLRPVAPWKRIRKNFYPSCRPDRVIKGEKGTVFRILFLAFSAAREKEKRAPLSSSLPPPTGRTQAAVIVLAAWPWENNACCLHSAGGGGGRMRRSILLLSRSGESQEKYSKNGTLFTLNNSIGAARRVKIFADSFPGRNWPQVFTNHQ
jgi:hypothetical protein